MPLPTLGRNSALIRKMQDCVILLAPEATAAITSITTGASSALVDFTTVHSAYKSLGRHTKDDGLVWGRDINAEDTFSHGVSEPTRRDITQDIMTLQVVLQESQRQTMQLEFGADFSALTPTATTGEIALTKPVAPSTINYRLLALAADGAGTGAYYVGRFLPRVSVTSIDEVVWNETEEKRTSVTFTAYVDDVLGYSAREMWGGPGLKANLVAMGFPAAV